MAFDSDMRRFTITTGSVPTTNVRGVITPDGECLYQEYIGASDKYSGVIKGKLADLTARFSVMEDYELSYTDPDEPDIISISPTSGTTAGGTTVVATTTGTNSSQCSVTVGGVAATTVRCNATSVSFVTPAGTAGAKAVVITTAEGTDTLAAAFTYS